MTGERPKKGKKAAKIRRGYEAGIRNSHAYEDAIRARQVYLPFTLSEQAQQVLGLVPPRD
jgi:hypothetical protein